MDFDFKIALYLFIWVSVFALFGVLNLLKYSLFFRNYLSKFVFFALLTFGTCCLALVDVSKLKKYHTLSRKGSSKRKTFYISEKSSLEFLLNFEISWIWDILLFWSNMLFLHLYPLFTLQMTQNSTEFQNFYKMLEFLKKSRFSKKIVAFFTFSRLHIAKLENVNQ